jgi:zinc transport system substrate-binding protein
MSLLTLCACSADPASDQADDDRQLKIVSTVFPVWDWCREIIGDNPGNVKLSFLLGSGSDLHSYQPSASDIMQIADSDLFVYIGGESDTWTEDALKHSANEDQSAISVMGLLDHVIKEEELKEGMQEEEHEHEAEYDEHVWLSLRNAEIVVAKLAETISEMDPDNGETYQANASAYIDQLSRLDAQYLDAVKNADLDTLLFADRFPFRYLCDDYGLDYYAAFAGCSAETEASFETILFLAHKADELGLKHILTIENSDERIASTVIENTEKKDMDILHMDSMQNKTRKDAEEGVTYLSVMESNLSVLKQALSKGEN